jgi:hypothetical protein
MAKDPEEMVKEKVKDAGKALERGIDDAASSIRKKGKEIQDYLKRIHAEIEEWKFGLEESKDGFRIEWRVVAVIRRPKKKSDDKSD